MMVQSSQPRMHEQHGAEDEEAEASAADH